MGGDFLSDLSLREGLIYHLKDALERLRQGSNIRNPFLEQIKLNYGSLFGVVREVASRVFTDVVVPEEEIGFLVIHFGASVERQKQLPERVRALLICSTGIGSSKLLQIRLQKELPQIEIVGRVSWYEAARTDKDKYDLMISTVELPLDRTQYIKVSPLLSQKEVEHLKTYIQTERHRMKSGSYNEETEKTELLAYEQLVNLKSTMDEIVSLISHFEVVQLQEQVEDLQLIIREACFHEREKGVLTEVQKVAQKLMQREQNGSVTIGKRFALFHTRCDEIKRASISVYQLKKPLQLEREPPFTLSYFLLMLAPQTLSKETLEILSEISAMLLDNDMIHLLETGQEAEIRNYVANHLKQYIFTKIESE